MKHLDNDFEVVGPDNGIYLESPNGTKYQVTVDDGGVLSVVTPPPPPPPTPTGVNPAGVAAVKQNTQGFTGEIDLFSPAGARFATLNDLKNDPVFGRTAYKNDPDQAIIWPGMGLANFYGERWVTLADGTKVYWNPTIGNWVAGTVGKP